MSDIKTLLDEYAATEQALRAQLNRLAIAMTMLTMEHGKPTKDGRIVVRASAKARKKALSFDLFDDKFGGSNDPTKGALSITAIPRKVADDG